MPTRLIREAINSSPRVNSLSPGAELFYRRLLLVADDYGRFHASPATLRGACWPTCPEKITESQVSEWLRECASGDRPLVDLYVIGGARYLELSEFGQQRRSKSKFPDPLGATARQALEAMRQPKAEPERAEAAPDNNCLAIDNGLQTNAEQLLRTSRSRISEAEAEAEADCETPPAPRTNITQFTPAPKSDLADLAARMYRLHPKAKHRTLVEGAIVTAVQERGADPDKMEQCHTAWCATESWMEKNGSFAPPLAEWIDDEGYLKWPVAREPPLHLQMAKTSRTKEIIDSL